MTRTEQETIDETEDRPSKKSPNRRRLVVIAGIFLLVTLIGVGCYLGYQRYKQRPEDRIPATYSTQLLFDLYYPTMLPTGYTIDPTSYKIEEETVLVFKATKEDAPNIVFAEQEKPADFQFNLFHEQSLIKPRKVEGTPHKAAFGKLRSNDDLTLLSVVTDESWLFITTKAKLGQAEAELITKGLKLQR